MDCALGDDSVVVGDGEGLGVAVMTGVSVGAGVGGGVGSVFRVISFVLESVAPLGLVTVRLTVFCPYELYVCDGFRTVEVSPPPKSHCQPVTLPVACSWHWISIV